MTSSRPAHRGSVAVVAGWRINDAVDWRGPRRRDPAALIQAGTFRSDAGALFGPVPWGLWGSLVTDEIDDKRRLLQALNCLLVETPAGRVLVETGIGERVNDKVRELRAYDGSPVVPALEAAGFDAGDRRRRGHEPPPLRPRRRPPAGRRHEAFPRATIVAQRAEWEVALDDNTRIVASYDQPELSLSATGARTAGRTASAELLPGCRSCRPGGTRPGTRRSSCGRRTGRRPLAFFGDLCMRPWSANPRWVTSFDDFPLNRSRCKGDLFAQAADEDWLIVLSHEPDTGRPARPRP